jgi:hypothetical protein
MSTDRDLAAKLDEHLEPLFVEGGKNMATMSPGTVALPLSDDASKAHSRIDPIIAHHVILLERILVAAGIVPESRRSADPQGYRRSLRAKAARSRD